MKEYDGFLVDEEFNFYSARTKRKLTPSKGSDGYLQVQYKTKDGKSHHNRVHVILAHCFIPNPYNYKYINHIDSDKLNNSLENLEWCTNSYNVKHCWDNNKRTHHNNTAINVWSKDNEFIGTYKSIRECAKILKLDRHKIARVLKGELKFDYLKYLFSYVESPTTIESVA